MRELVEGQYLNVRAIAGLYVVTLAWDFAHEVIPPEDLLGFAVERRTIQADGTESGPIWLKGSKRFKDKDVDLPAGTQVETSEHPIQSFQWGDYIVDSGRAYRYRVVPVLGTPLDLRLDDAKSTTITIATEVESGADGDPATVRHDVYFNRGVAGSQAFVRRFPDIKPEAEDDPAAPHMQWLSRNLFEALTGFIDIASGADAAGYAVRAALYEFRYRPVAEAFKRARDAGADVDVRYEAKSYREENEAVVDALQLHDICKPLKNRAGIRHNKFIVLLKGGTPIAVWTGSTNISAGGIFGHSNVGHVVWDEGIAARYLRYWNELAKPTVRSSALRSLAQDVDPTPDDLPPADRVLTVFSPRDPEDDDSVAPTLHWYGELLASAKRIACMTFAFNFDDVFQKVIRGETDAQSYLIFDKAVSGATETEIRQNRNAVVAIGSKLEDDDVETFVGERLTGFNRNLYIHTKFMLVDPLGKDPIVVTGSANFSENSQETNDENMLVIRGDLRVADIYFGEFMRIFNHLYFRYIVSLRNGADDDDPEAGFLKAKTERWLPSHLGQGPKSRRRRFYMADD